MPRQGELGSANTGGTPAQRLCQARAQGPPFLPRFPETILEGGITPLLRGKTNIERV